MMIDFDTRRFASVASKTSDVFSGDLDETRQPSHWLSICFDFYDTGGCR